MLGETVSQMHLQQWSAYGYELRCEWEEERLGPYVRGLALPDWESSTKQGADSVFQIIGHGNTRGLKHNGTWVAKDISLPSLYTTLKRHVHLDVAVHAPDLVFVHAGVVLTDHGLLLLPGRSFAGKSTLVKALVVRGARYYSDEFALVDAEGLVRPFARPLVQRKEKGNRLVFLPDLNWDQNQPPMPISAVVVTSFNDQAFWCPAPLTSGQALVKLLENTVSARVHTKRALAFLATAVRGARCCQSDRGDSEQSADLILEWIEKTTSPSDMKTDVVR